jgi:hypothetical protein
MKPTLSIVAKTKPTGSLSARVIRANGPSELRRAPAWPPLPAGLPLRRKVATFGRELALHARIAGKGFWRGLTHGQGVIAVSRLYATVLRADGRVENLGLICTKVITDAGVTFLRDDWNNNAQDYTTFNFHGCGTGVAAEAAADTALGTESTTALNPDNTRATGTRSVPASNQWRSVGTATFDAVAAITEHGILSQAATGGGTLWDRSVFSAINVANGDSIQFTYTCTLSSGG